MSWPKTALVIAVITTTKQCQVWDAALTWHKLELLVVGVLSSEQQLQSRCFQTNTHICTKLLLLLKDSLVRGCRDQHHWRGGCFRFQSLGMRAKSYSRTALHVSPEQWETTSQMLGPFYCPAPALPIHLYDCLLMSWIFMTAHVLNRKKWVWKNIVVLLRVSACYKGVLLPPTTEKKSVNFEVAQLHESSCPKWKLLMVLIYSR